MIIKSVPLFAVLVAFSSLFASIEPEEKGFLELEGARLYYEVFGEGPAVVLIHDGLLHSAVWENQIEVFSEDHRVIQYDRRGYGRSEAKEKAFSNVDDLHRLLEHLKVKRATLVGSSAGGGLAIDYTLAHPDRVDRLVLVGAVVGGFGYSEHFIQRGRGIFAADIDTTIERCVNDRYHIAPGNREARKRALDLLKANPQNLTNPWRLYRYQKQPDPPALKRLHEIEVPVLLVTASEDIPDVHAHAGAIQAGIAGAKRIVIPDAGHLVYLERPEAFNEIVLGFLSED